MPDPLQPFTLAEEIRDLLEAHWKWLRDSTALRHVDGAVEITTPFLDRHNDCLQIYAERAKEGFLLHDDGYILADLAMSGFKLGSRHRAAVLTEVLNGFGVQREGDRLQVRAALNDFPTKKHDLVQAMLAVSDMFYIAQPNVAQMFIEDVAAWLDVKEIRYTPNSRITGRSGYTHHFDFIIPKSTKAPERALRAVNSARKDYIESIIFSWQDTREVRAKDAESFVVINDSEKPVAPSALEALRTYAITPVPWTKREDFAAALAA